MQRDSAWLVIYSALVSIVNHPRNTDVPTSQELGWKTDYYLKEFERRFPCPDGSQEELPPQASSATYSAATASNKPTP